MKFDYILWDLDGTLTDPGIGITNSVMYALEKFGIKVEDRSVLYPFIGPPLIESFAEHFGFDEEKGALAVKYYREYFVEAGMFENSVYDGIIDTLIALKNAGVKNILATSKPEIYAKPIMDKFELSPYFTEICGSRLDGSHETKADVIRQALLRADIKSTDKVLMVGDRKFDINGAHECDIKCSAVLWGYGSVSEFEENKADYIVSDLGELMKVIKGE